MSDQLKAARWQIGNLTYQDLLVLRDDIAKLLAAYGAGGALRRLGKWPDPLRIGVFPGAAALRQ